MSIQTTSFTLTQTQWSALQTEIKQKFNFTISGNIGISPKLHDTTISWAFDNVATLVVTVDGPWPFAGIATKDIKELVTAVTA